MKPIGKVFRIGSESYLNLQVSNWLCIPSDWIWNRPTDWEQLKKCLRLKNVFDKYQFCSDWPPRRDTVWDSLKKCFGLIADLFGLTREETGGWGWFKQVLRINPRFDRIKFEMESHIVSDQNYDSDWCGIGRRSAEWNPIRNLHQVLHQVELKINKLEKPPKLFFIIQSPLFTLPRLGP